MDGGSNYYSSGSHNGSSEAGMEAGRTRLLNHVREEFELHCCSLEDGIRIEGSKIFKLFKKKVINIIEKYRLSVNMKLVNEVFNEYLMKISITDLVMERLTREDIECIEVLHKEAGEDRKYELIQFAEKCMRTILSKNLKKFDKTIDKALLLIGDIIKNRTGDKRQLEKPLNTEINKGKKSILFLKEDTSVLISKVELLNSFIDSIKLSTEKNRNGCYSKFKVYNKARGA
ncbi:hypothetical protein LQZ19_15920 [Treponema primitia]|uniref:hypothetical protein n=1 Tax=Treponema primitia TaxID=88058 RepID=UPI00397E9AC8